MPRVGAALTTVVVVLQQREAQILTDDVPRKMTAPETENQGKETAVNGKERES